MSGNLGDFEGRLVGSWKLDSLLGVRGGKAFYLTSAKKNSGITHSYFNWYPNAMNQRHLQVGIARGN